jgi:YVTN family beta-propeller protein
MESRVSTKVRPSHSAAGSLPWWPVVAGWLLPLLFLLAILLLLTWPGPVAGAAPTVGLSRGELSTQTNLAESQPYTMNLTARPIVIPADGLSFSTLTATVEISGGDSVDDGTVVVFTTTHGTFPGGLVVTPRPTGVITTEAEDPVVVMTGTWTNWIEPDASGGEVIYSCNISDRVSYEFTATAVSVIFQKQFNAGVARVYLDGVQVGEIDTYWDDPPLHKLFQQEELIASGLPYAPHEVEVEATGLVISTCVVVDAFRVYGHERNDAYLTAGGLATTTLTSELTPGTAQVTACAHPACDTLSVTMASSPTWNFAYLPLVFHQYPQQPLTDCQELIQNGGFEDETAWVPGVTPRPARYSMAESHSGSWSVLLGLKPGEPDVRSYSSVRQAITLPSETDSATFSFWYYPLSELDGGDRQECLLLDEDDRLLAVLMRTNVNTAAWTRQVYDISAYAGRTVKVYCNAYNDGDGSGVTGYYLDDVSVYVCADGEPPPEPPEPPPPPATGCYLELRATTGVGHAPHGVAVNSAAKRLYVANHADDTLSAINSETYALVKTVSVGDGPNGVAYNPANDKIYVANRNGNSVTVLRASDLGLVKTIKVGLQPNGVAVNANTNRVYVANYGGDKVSIIDGATNTESKRVQVGANPAMIAVDPITNKAYVALHGAGKVAMIDGAGNVTQIPLHTGGAYGIAVDTVRHLVYVTTIDTFRIIAIDGINDTYLGWAEIRRLPDEEPVPLRMIAVNPLIGPSGHLFVTTAGSDGGWDRVLLIPKGWPEYFARAYALALSEPREGIAFEPTTLRVFVTSRGANLVAAYSDGEPACMSNFSRLIDYRLSVCVANPDGTCRQTLIR